MELFRNILKIKFLLMKIKIFLTMKMLSLKLRTVLQTYFHGIRFQTLKDAIGGNMSAFKVGAEAAAHPSEGRGWGRQNIYHKEINKSLILPSKSFSQMDILERLAL